MIYKHVMIVIGCGGGFFHGLSLMRNWLAKRDDAVRVVLVDADMVEPRNRFRQWATPGVAKTTCAKLALASLGFPADQILEVKEMLDDAMCNGTDGRLGGSSLEPTRLGMVDCRDVERWWVVGMPDNHQARVLTMHYAKMLHKLGKRDVTVCTSGNAGTDGFAYLGRMVPGQPMLNDWLIFHPDIVEEAEREIRDEAQFQQELAEGIGCGTRPDTGGITQTAMSNFMSSACRWQALERAAQEVGGWDYQWAEEDGKIQMWSKARGVAGVLER